MSQSRRPETGVELESRVAVIGSGYVGTVVAACLAWLGRWVVGVESDPHKAASLRSGRVPFFEPRLDVLLKQAMTAGRLSFTSDIALAIECSDVVFICVGTPTGSDGHADTSAVEAAVLAVAANTRRRHVLVTKSTVPIGTGGRLERLVASTHGESVASMLPTVSCPEFLREGSAVGDFLHPDRILIGGEDRLAVDAVARVYAPIIAQDFLGGRPDRRPALITTDRTTAETAKYAANAFLATKVSFINEIAAICEAVDADVTEVSRAIGMDSRIGPAFLAAGAGWGGSCFGKDISELAATAEDHGRSARLLRAAVEVNRDQKRAVVDKVRHQLGSLSHRRVCLLGLAFKADTDDLRDAPAVDIARLLIEGGAEVVAHDPLVRRLPEIPSVSVLPSARDAMTGVDAVVLVTDWGEYADLDWSSIRADMRGCVVVDGRNALDSEEMSRLGFSYVGIGRGTVRSRGFEIYPRERSVSHDEIDDDLEEADLSAGG